MCLRQFAYNLANKLLLLKTINDPSFHPVVPKSWFQFVLSGNRGSNFSSRSCDITAAPVALLYTRAHTNVQCDVTQSNGPGFTLISEARTGPGTSHTVVFVFRGVCAVYDGQGQLCFPERVCDTVRNRDAAASVALLHCQFSQYVFNRASTQRRVLRATIFTGALRLSKINSRNKSTSWNTGTWNIFTMTYHKFFPFSIINFELRTII